MASGTMERIGGEITLARLADTLFMEMFPDSELAPLFKGIACREAVKDLQALLRVLLADSAIETGSELAGLCPVFTDRPLDAARRMRVARIVVDCLVEERIPPDVTLLALDRLYTLLHRGAPLHRGRAPGSWTRPRLHVVRGDADVV